MKAPRTTVPPPPWPAWPPFQHFHSQDVTVNTVTTSFVIFFGTLFLAALLALGLR